MIYSYSILFNSLNLHFGLPICGQLPSYAILKTVTLVLQACGTARSTLLLGKFGMYIFPDSKRVDVSIYPPWDSV